MNSVGDLHSVEFTVKSITVSTRDNGESMKNCRLFKLDVRKDRLISF